MESAGTQFKGETFPRTSPVGRLVILIKLSFSTWENFIEAFLIKTLLTLCKHTKKFSLLNPFCTNNSHFNSTNEKNNSTFTRNPFWIWMLRTIRRRWRGRGGRGRRGRAGDGTTTSAFWSQRKEEQKTDSQGQRIFHIFPHEQVSQASETAKGLER